MPALESWPIAAPAGQPGSAVWHVDLATARADDPTGLSPDERARAARFVRREDRERFIGSHLALRHILAGYLGRHPDELRFGSEPGGKPRLAHPDPEGLRFNLSHSGRHALVGVASTATIGVDVEAVRPIGDALTIARAHFHPAETAELASLPDPDLTSAFFACWTRKEAVVKALGLGLAQPLDRFRVTLPPAAAAVLRWEDETAARLDWSMHHLDLGPDAVGAVAITRAGEPCARYRLPPGWAASR
ncbi:4'-phosphopantetheinyl transferase family protein [Methylobacterium sp. J-068]|uniref:4'-phosphopantetheinyl transferase family protein n=1 Tax=Methylobacterium sp. J-068 TaxID=2836649 RepID=UPI001FBB0668|nr:4'-phosphopantetheinyl transferase superfamily protein [Methylobacterium sp. J-068]MCJ2033816.1 4'-phosphopantetheinyl transferase superfamily protein [Methylobacterium sp. J-068]